MYLKEVHELHCCILKFKRVRITYLIEIKIKILIFSHPSNKIITLPLSSSFYATSTKLEAIFIKTVNHDIGCSCSKPHIFR